MRKRIRIVLAALSLYALAVLLGACGDSTPTTAAIATTAAATTAAATTAAATTAAATTGVATTAAVTTAAATTAMTGTTAAGTTAATTPGTAASGPNVDCKGAQAAPGRNVKVGIMVQDAIPALLQAIDGVKQGLAKCGYIEGQNLTTDVKNANGDIASLTTIGQLFHDNKVDAIFAVGTQALVAAYNTNKDGSIPIIFNSVTDPYQAIPTAIKSQSDHSFVTGVQASPPVEQAMDVIKKLVPNLKAIGLVWNKSEKNSEITTIRARAYAKTLGVDLVEAPVSQSTDVQQAAQSLVDKVDAFFSTTDVTVNKALEAYVKVAIDNKKPLIGNDPASAKRGAAVALGLDYPYQGALSAVQAIPILNGTVKPDAVDIQNPTKVFVGVNLKSADAMGLKLPDDVVKNADAQYSS